MHDHCRMTGNFRGLADWKSEVFVKKKDKVPISLQIFSKDGCLQIIRKPIEKKSWGRQSYRTKSWRNFFAQTGWVRFIGSCMFQQDSFAKLVECLDDYDMTVSKNEIPVNWLLITNKLGCLYENFSERFPASDITLEQREDLHFDWQKVCPSEEDLSNIYSIIRELNLGIK